MNKVQGGTPRGGLPLCVTCRAAHNITGVNMQAITICRVGAPFRVQFPVSQCSTYDDKRNPAVWEMEKIAWEVNSRNRGPVGFADNGRMLEIVITPPGPDRNSPDRAVPTKSPVSCNSVPEKQG